MDFKKCQKRDMFIISKKCNHYTIHLPSPIMANRDKINMILKQHILETIFPKILPKYNKMLVQNHNAYIVVIGGVSVEMCARLDPTAQAFLKNVFSEDVDIKIVIKNKKADLHGIHEIRMALLKDTMRRLRSFVNKAKLGWDESINTNIKLDTSLLNHKVESVRKGRIASINIEFSEGKIENKIAYPLLDTSFFAQINKPFFHDFQRFMKTDVPIPFYEVNGINFASCEYMLYDNCRMLVERANYLKEKQSLYALMKFIKLVIKFMSLYVLRKKIKKLPKELDNIYEDAYIILRRINIFKLKSGMRKMHQIKYDMHYVDSIVSKLDTILKAYDMRSLIKATTPVLAGQKS